MVSVSLMTCAAARARPSFESLAGSGKGLKCDMGGAGKAWRTKAPAAAVGVRRSGGHRAGGSVAPGRDGGGLAQAGEQYEQRTFGTVEQQVVGFAERQVNADADAYPVIVLGIQ